MKLLYAEDEKALSDTISEILDFYKHTVDAVYNGEGALYYLENEKCDGAILDIMMPKMDGWEATRVIRKMKREDSDLPILAMSANAFLEDRRKSLESGMNGHISKPVDYDEVRRIIGEQLWAVRSH